MSSWAIELARRAGQVDGRKVRGTFSSKEIKFEFERGECVAELRRVTLAFLRTLEDAKEHDRQTGVKESEGVPHCSGARSQHEDDHEPNEHVNRRQARKAVKERGK